jgi:hypothetical protein
VSEVASSEGRFLSLQRSGEVQFHRQVATIAGADDLSITAGYRRCLDFDPRDIEGQDFCGYVLEDGWLVAVVADGVSQSFMGHLAAEECGRGLLEILLGRRGTETTVEWLREAIQARQPTLADRVARWELSVGIPEMVRHELEKKRGTTGSQTVFAVLSMNARARRGEVFILGDVTATVLGADGVSRELAADAKGRWSSTKGIRGELVRHELRDVDSVVLRSDGTGSSWGADLRAVEVAANFTDLAKEMAGRDDLSFVAASFQGARSVVGPDERPQVKAAPSRDADVEENPPSRSVLPPGQAVVGASPFSQPVGDAHAAFKIPSPTTDEARPPPTRVVGHKVGQADAAAGRPAKIALGCGALVVVSLGLAAFVAMAGLSGINPWSDEGDAATPPDLGSLQQTGTEKPLAIPAPPPPRVPSRRTHLMDTSEPQRAIAPGESPREPERAADAGAPTRRVEADSGEDGGARVESPDGAVPLHRRHHRADAPVRVSAQTGGAD